MKKIWFLALLPLLLSAAGCSFVKKSTVPPVAINPVTNTENNVCTVPDISSTTETINAKTILPPVSEEEKNKTFTYEDKETGVRLNYPGSCYFNKGIFQCSDFTLSIWILDTAVTPNPAAEKTFNEGETQLKYVFSHNNKTYALMAWYDGVDNPSLDTVIDNIFKSISFSK